VTYYNSTPIQGDLLLQARRIAGEQDSAVMRVFEDGKPHTPSDVWAQLVNGGRNILPTSIRRSISTLTKAGALNKLDDSRMGPHGRPERCWQSVSGSRA
jgi:hypothetical protein